ncbi:hypothetical protein BHF71_00830 [Vulcanibacillus modesticaldus]|uniref:16S rRNA (Cytosine(1402)-N(4))-methyltransferase n=1 Tax=Vulcanibacillus modesticaldus TaxID=337097 RepID=A0A1D2YXM7_9BACI|nr:class I SAM-dependent methyltransferase [Vulcanibacillus modesticaldus]OEG00482.1 hypothetical protein BHF71_00830 [Vulcanibacillus modesticaldus]
MSFQRVLEYAHKLVEERTNQGDIVVDATLGNGNDTLFLAKLVGDSGRVYGFDVQREAIAKTIAKLKIDNLDSRVECIEASHEYIDKWVKEPVTAAMFNLGYLPGSDKSITTKPQTTIKAIEILLKLLKVGGVITLVLYIGHDGGAEAAEVEKYLQTLPQKKYAVIKYRFLNQVHNPPFLIAIEKIRE